MNVLLFILIVILQWVMSNLSGIFPSVFLFPVLLLMIIQLISSKKKMVAKWWILLIMLPASIIGVDVFFHLPRRLMNGIPYTLEQFNETAIWALGLGLVQCGVFYICHWLWVFVKKIVSQK